jgi:transposase
MHRFIEGQDRAQASFLPASLEDYVDADNTARVIEAFVEALDLSALGFAVEPATTGRPGYHPAPLLKLYIYGYRAPCARRGGNGIICHPQTC